MRRCCADVTFTIIFFLFHFEKLLESLHRFICCDDQVIITSAVYCFFVLFCFFSAVQGLVSCCNFVAISNNLCALKVSMLPCELWRICFHAKSANQTSFFLCRKLQVSSENAFSRSVLQLVSLSLGLSPAVAFSHLSFFGRKDLPLIPELLISLSPLGFFSLIPKTSSVWSNGGEIFCSFIHGCILQRDNTKS